MPRFKNWKKTLTRANRKYEWTNTITGNKICVKFIHKPGNIVGVWWIAELFSKDGSKIKDISKDYARREDVFDRANKYMKNNPF